MFESMQKRENGGESAVSVDIAPLIDMVFILLIFFLVTTTFSRETGMEVNRPEAVMAKNLENTSMRISISPSGAVYTGGRQVSLAECRNQVRQFIDREGGESVVIIPDEEVSAKHLVAVMDAAKQGGAGKIAVATRRKDGQ